MNFDAVIFDMDGVVTRTAVVHSAAWKRTFDEYLRRRADQLNEPFRAFTAGDYLAFVDGRPRYAGVELFLQSRGIEIPLGDPADASSAETVCGLGNRKNELFRQVLAEGVEVFDSTIALVRQLIQREVKVGIATSSKNCDLVLKSAGIAGLFETRVDGVLSVRLGLKGKPEPDIFLTACHNLNVSPRRTVVVEDAVSGVQAGAKGRFGLVLGVARGGNAAELSRNGADLVVGDLSEISIDEIDRWFQDRARTPDGYSTVRAQESV